MGKRHRPDCLGAHWLNPSKCECDCEEKTWRLIIEKSDKSKLGSRVDIILSDNLGYLLCREFDKIVIDLVPGRYKYRIGISGEDCEIILNEHTKILI